MSVYSGFTTRQQEQYYYKLIEKTFELLSYKLASVLKLMDDSFFQDKNEKWFQRMKKVFKLINEMEKQKYMEPKFSATLAPLLKFLLQKYSFNKNVSGPTSVFSFSTKGGYNNYSLNDEISMSSLKSGDTKLSLNPMRLLQQKEDALLMKEQEKEEDDEEEQDSTPQRNELAKDIKQSYTGHDEKNKTTVLEKGLQMTMNNFKVSHLPTEPSADRCRSVQTHDIRGKVPADHEYLMYQDSYNQKFLLASNNQRDATPNKKAQKKLAQSQEKGRQQKSYFVQLQPKVNLQTPMKQARKKKHYKYQGADYSFNQNCSILQNKYPPSQISQYSPINNAFRENRISQEQPELKLPDTTPQQVRNFISSKGPAYAKSNSIQPNNRQNFSMYQEVGNRKQANRSFSKRRNEENQRNGLLFPSNVYNQTQPNKFYPQSKYVTQLNQLFQSKREELGFS